MGVKSFGVERRGEGGRRRGARHWRQGETRTGTTIRGLTDGPGLRGACREFSSTAS